VGPGFVVNPDGSLGINGPRAGNWPYTGSGCTIAAANGLRLDSTNGLWVEPPDLRQPISQAGSNSTSLTVSGTPQSLAIGSISVTNLDTCRSALISGAVTAFFSVNIAAGGNVSVIGSTYDGTPPSSTGQPTLFSHANNGAGLTIDSYSLTIPFTYTATPGQVSTIGIALWATGASTTLNTIAWNYSGLVFTTRSGW